MSLTRPAATDTLASPALDLVLDEYATAIEGLQDHQVTKRVTAALSSAMSGTGLAFTTTNYDLNTRFLFAFPVTPTRWRLKVRNFSVLNNTAGSGTATVTAFHGAAGTVSSTSDLYRWTGNIASTPTQVTWGATLINGQWVSNTSVVMTDDTEIVSDWVTNTTYGMGAPVVFSFGFANVAGNCTAAGADSAGCLTRYQVGAAAAANATTFTKTTPAAYFDCRVEYEYSTDYLASGDVRNPVVLFVGDSITAGHVQSEFSSAGPWIFKTDSYPEQVGLRRQFGVVNAGVGQTRVRQSPISGTTSGWDQATSTAHPFLARFDLATSVPDACVIMVGTNDVGAATTQSYTSLTSSYATLIDNVRAWGITKIYLCTIPPGGYGLPHTVVASCSSGAKLFTDAHLQVGGTTISDAPCNMLTPGMAVTGTSVGTNAVIDSIVGPNSFTVTVASTAGITQGTLTVGDSSPDIGTQAAETLRSQLNAWIRTKPNNVTGVFDVAAHLMGALPAIADARWVPYYPHPTLAGFARIADAIRL